AFHRSVIRSDVRLDYPQVDRIFAGAERAQEPWAASLDAARAVARALAARLGASTIEIPDGEKARYHAAAVLASNFPVVLLALAERVLMGTGIDADQARRALRPLFHAAAENVRSRTAADALTGPVVRGDVGTVRAHLEALRDDPESLDAYRVLARAAIDVARQAGTDATKLAEMRELLG
ncbi:MAG TPA: DUF2520 domain-containing protein, partial [Gemmatimonadaceae bacterium]|nr:DUF2520 domain-containing protein [Gemmatimonadaceae bacterium]